jgi:hypothetical protein
MNVLLNPMLSRELAYLFSAPAFFDLGTRYALLEHLKVVDDMTQLPETDKVRLLQAERELADEQVFNDAYDAIRQHESEQAAVTERQLQTLRRLQERT